MTKIRFLSETEKGLPNFIWLTLGYSKTRSKTKTNKKGKVSMTRGFYTDMEMEQVWEKVKSALEELQ